jgi:hypothetical protein
MVPYIPLCHLIANRRRGSRRLPAVSAAGAAAAASDARTVAAGSGAGVADAATASGAAAAASDAGTVAAVSGAGAADAATAFGAAAAGAFRRILRRLACRCASAATTAAAKDPVEPSTTLHDQQWCANSGSGKALSSSGAVRHNLCLGLEASLS